MYLFSNFHIVKFFCAVFISSKCARILVRFIIDATACAKFLMEPAEKTLQAVGSPITAPGFAVHLNKYVRSLPFFGTPPAAL